MIPENAYRNCGAELADRTLDQIAALADDAESSASMLADFIARFRGHPMPGDSAKVSPVPAGHAGQIDRLRENLAHVGSLARELGTIG